jgi:hypothetical protein
MFQQALGFAYSWGRALADAHAGSTPLGSNMAQRSRRHPTVASIVATTALAIGAALASGVAAVPAVAAPSGVRVASLAAPAALVLAIPPVASDCSQDVTDAFNAWLEEVSNGSVIALMPRGCYLSNGTIFFRNKRNITVLGNRATVRPVRRLARRARRATRTAIASSRRTRMAGVRRAR